MQDASASRYTQLIQLAINRGKRPDISDACVYDVVFSHDQANGDDYVWLWPHYGKVLWVDFEEPIGSGNWRTYNRFWWGRHGALVSHDPATLVEEHVNFYVNPQTRKIRLRFWFENPAGIAYSMEPTRHFYELERDYFLRHGLCQQQYAGDANVPTIQQATGENAPGPRYACRRPRQ